jgi:hypothetical protein
MKHLLLLVVATILTASPQAFAQQGGNAIYQSNSSGTAVAISAFQKLPGTPVQGAPYSASMTNQSTETLADGNRIVQTSSGTIARDSLGRTRQDAPLPSIGNLSAANAPHLVFIQDPVTQMSYTLDLTNKTAQKMPALPPPGLGPESAGAAGPGAPGGPGVVTIRMGAAGGIASPMGLPPAGGAPGGPPVFFLQRGPLTNDQAAPGNQETPMTQDLGSQTMEGILANGTRVTITIPAGQIGNDRAIDIVTEVWTSPDLKTVVYSKRSDPRMGEQTFQLTNIVRGEPDPSLFTVPADFKIIDGPQPIVYRTIQ